MACTSARASHAFPTSPRCFRLTLACCLLLAVYGCTAPHPRRIGFVPRVSGSLTWEPAQAGARNAAHATGAAIEWSPPTREDDYRNQIHEIERLTEQRCDGLIVAPDHALALVTPVRRALDRGISTVVIGSALQLPAGNRLAYVLSDEQLAGEMAADRLALLLHGKGTAAILGMSPATTDTAIRARTLELRLAQRYPSIRIVEKRFGTFSTPNEQQMAREVLQAHPGLNALIAFTWASVIGANRTVQDSEQYRNIRIIGFDPVGRLPNPAHLDSVIVERTHDMSAAAVRILDRMAHGEPAPPVERIPPELITRENIDSTAVKQTLAMDWAVQGAPAAEGRRW